MKKQSSWNWLYKVDVPFASPRPKKMRTKVTHHPKYRHTRKMLPKRQSGRGRKPWNLAWRESWRKLVKYGSVVNMLSWNRSWNTWAGSAEPSTVLKWLDRLDQGSEKLLLYLSPWHCPHSLEMPIEPFKYFQEHAQDMSHEWALFSVASSPNMSMTSIWCSKAAPCWICLNDCFLTHNECCLQQWGFNDLANEKQLEQGSLWINFRPQTLQAKSFDEHLHLHHTCSIPSLVAKSSKATITCPSLKQRFPSLSIRTGRNLVLQNIMLPIII